MLHLFLLPFVTAYLDVERVDIDIPQIGTDIVVECEGDRIQVAVLNFFFTGQIWKIFTCKTLSKKKGRWDLVGPTFA